MSGTTDRHDLVGRVKALGALERLGAEIIESSMLLGDAAYDVEQGWVGTPVASSSPSPTPRRTTKSSLCWRAARRRSAIAFGPRMSVELALLFIATALLYLAASVLFIGDLAGVGRAGAFGRTARFAPLMVALGVPLHASQIVVWSLVLGVCPVEGIHFALSVASMLACLAYVLGRLRFPDGMPWGPSSPPGPRLPARVAVRGAGGRRGAAAAERAPSLPRREQLVRHRPLHARVGRGGRLPPAGAPPQAKAARRRQSLASHRRARPRRAPLRGGVPAVDDRHLTGTIWAREVQAGGAADVARAALSYAAWALIAGVLLLRAAAGWRGRRAAVGTILGFGLTMLVLVFYLMRSIIASRRHA